jgi:hypothetical protein
MLSFINILKLFSNNSDYESSIPECPYYECEGIRITAKYGHIEDKLNAIVNAPKFKNWAKNIKRDKIKIDEFIVTDVDFFGPINPSKLGFVKGYGIISDARTGDKIVSNIAFIRGGSVAVLIIVTIKETKEKRIILCKQIRFPTGDELIEACAGMLDDQVEDAEIEGVIFKELREEAGFDVKVCDLIYLGKIIPSGGACDEVIECRAWETTITQSEYNTKMNTLFGDKNESIQLKSFPFDTFDEVLNKIGDVKAECCWRRYLRYKSHCADTYDSE